MGNLENKLRQLQLGELNAEEVQDFREEGNKALIDHEHNGHSGRDARAFKDWKDGEDYDEDSL